MGEGVGNDFEDGVGARIAIVVDVGFDHDAVDAVDDGVVVFVEGELDVGFAELNLLPTGGGAGVKDDRGHFHGELTRGRGYLYLVDERDVAPARRSGPARGRRARPSGAA